MTEPSATVEQPHEVHPQLDHGMSIGKAAVITLVSIFAVTLSTYAVVKGSLSAGMTRLLAVVSLLSLVALVYGLIEFTLAVIAGVQVGVPLPGGPSKVRLAQAETLTQVASSRTSGARRRTVPLYRVPRRICGVAAPLCTC